jgi:carbonic anhydrase
MDQLLAGIKSGTEAKFKGLKLLDLLPRRKSYYLYEGSETTPPCEEDVKWLVMEGAITMSQKQLQDWERDFKNSARQLKPDMNRKILKSY